MLNTANETAWTIVNSQASSSIRCRDSFISEESAELVYKKLSFEDALFTAREYKRNFRNNKISGLFKDKLKAREKIAMGPTISDEQDLDADTETVRGYSNEISRGSG